MATLTAKDIIDASRLADAAYSYTDDQLAGKLALHEFSGWQPITFSSGSTVYISYNAEGFAAISPEGTPGGRTLAISFTGTQGLADIATDIAAGIADGFLVHYAKYKSFISQVWEAYRQTPNITKVLVTGHSLGGAMVELFLNQFANSNLDVVGVTFGSPFDSTLLSLPTRNLGMDRIIRIEHTHDPVVDAAIDKTDGGVIIETELDFRVERPESSALFNNLPALVAAYATGLPQEHGQSYYINTVNTIFGSPFRSEVLANYENLRAQIGTNQLTERHNGSAGGDVIFGLGGLDDIYAGASRDFLDGGAGADYIYGEAGNDEIYGGSEGDYLYGGLDNDNIYGGDGFDSLFGEQNEDTLRGGAGNDTLYGGENRDFLYGDGDIDTLIGEAGNDVLDGGDGDDTANYAAFRDANGNLNYRVVSLGNNRFTVADQRPGSPDGTDELVRVEYLNFGGRTESIGYWVTQSGGTAPAVSALPLTAPYQPPSSVPDSPVGVSNLLLSVTPQNKQLTVGQSVALGELFPSSTWVDNDGLSDIRWVAVQDRTAGGGYLTYKGSIVDANTVHEFAVSELAHWRFVAGANVSTDQIGFNIIQADGDFSPRLTTGAVVSTVVPTVTQVPQAAPIVIQGTDQARLDLDLRNGSAGEEGSRAQFVINRNGDLSGDIVVEWRIQGNGINPADSRDFSAMTGQVTLYSGATSRNFSIGVTEDQIDEFDESFRIELSVVSGNATFTDDDANYTILDNDLPYGGDPNVDDHGNNFASATSIAEDKWARGFVEQAGDQDYFRFDLRAGVGYEIILIKDRDLSLIGGDPNASFPTLPQPIAELYNAAGNLVTTLPPGGVSTHWRYFFENTHDGTYFLRVRENGDNDIGQYFVRADIRVRADDFAPNASTTGLLSIGGTIAGGHERDNDVDWIGVDVTAGQTYQFSLFDQRRLTLEGNQANTNNGLYYFGVNNANFRLVDETGQTVAVRTSLYPTSSNLLQFTAEQTGRYYIEVDGTPWNIPRYVVNSDVVAQQPVNPALVIQPGTAGTTDVRFSIIGGLAIDDEVLTVNANTTSAVLFDLSGVSAQATYAAVELFMFATSGAIAGDIAVDAPGIALLPGSDFSQVGSLEFVTAVQSPTVGQWVTIEITELYNQWISGSRPNNGIVLSTTEFSSQLMSFYSSNYAADPTLRPRLVLDGPDFQQQTFGQTTASITEDLASFTASIGLTGVNSGFAGAAALGVWGNLSVNTSGNEWTYTPNAAVQTLRQGQTVVDRLVITSINGHSQLIEVSISGLDDQPIILGTEANVFDESGGQLIGRLLTRDVDSPMALAFSQTTRMGSYGQLSIAADGSYAYQLNNQGKLALASGAIGLEFFELRLSDNTPFSLRLSINGTDNDNLVGNTASNVLSGAIGNDIIQGLAGNDTLDGGAGSDTLDGGADVDTLSYAGSNAAVTVNLGGPTQTATGGHATGDVISNFENITGSSHADGLTGNTGANVLDGGADALADTLTGGLGNDTYIIRSATDNIVEVAGGGLADRAKASVSFTLAADDNIEFLETTNAAGLGLINLTGNAIAQSITGNAGNNILNGGVDALSDTLAGGLGDDTYIINTSTDLITEFVSSGTADAVKASVSFTLANDDYIDIMQTTDAALLTAINLTGNGIRQVITGNAGANILNGGIDVVSDTLVGGLGDDTYIINTSTDLITEFVAGGTADVVQASVSFALANDDYIETLQTTNAALATAINLTGNSVTQTIIGNAGANILNGMFGKDTLTGGLGADSFLFNTALNAASNRDTITDFNLADDTIQLENTGIFTALGAALGVLNVTMFKNLTTGGAVDATDRILYDDVTGALSYDADGNGATSAIQFATLTGAPTVTNVDFFVV